jgi:hypothetical protein
MNLQAGSQLCQPGQRRQPGAAGLMRVKPGDAADSYLVRKLEGAASISGGRMPEGGPFFNAATSTS